MIPTDKLQDFFFMNDADEVENYGFSSTKAAIALSGNLLKDKPKDEVSTIYLHIRVKSISV